MTTCSEQEGHRSLVTHRLLSDADRGSVLLRVRLEGDYQITDDEDARSVILDRDLHVRAVGEASDHEEGLYGDLYSLGVFREIDGRYCIGWPGDYSCNSSPTEDSVDWEETWAHNPVRGLREWFDEYLQERRDERRAELRQSVSV